MENVRTENFLGSPKLIVGQVTQDLVLETLGKLYIKCGRNIVLFNDIIKQINDLSVNVSEGKDIGAKVYIVDTINDIEDYEDGSLVYDSTEQNLYIIVNGEPVLLIEGKNAGSHAYVKRSGDSMYG